MYFDIINENKGMIIENKGGIARHKERASPIMWTALQVCRAVPVDRWGRICMVRMCYENGIVLSTLR